MNFYKNISLKKVFFLVFLLCPIIIQAQSTWDKPNFNNTNEEDSTGVSKKESKKSEKYNANKDEKYLEGAVTEVDGKVEWELDLDVPGKSAEQIYDIMLKCLSDITKEKNQIQGSEVSLVNEQEHKIIATIKELLTFRNNIISIDQAKLYFVLVATCSDNHLTVQMQRISYKYDEENGKGGNYYKAEEIITDGTSLNKAKTKIVPGFAKFRRKTIDRKDEIFNTIRQAVLD